MPRRIYGGSTINWFALLLIVAWALGFGVLAAETAHRRSRNPLVWFGFGAVLGPIATLILLAAPLGFCPVCLEPARGMLPVCTWCGSDLRRAVAPPHVKAGSSGRQETVTGAAPVTPADSNAPAESTFRAAQAVPAESLVRAAPVVPAGQPMLSAAPAVPAGQPMMSAAPAVPAAQPMMSAAPAVPAPTDAPSAPILAGSGIYVGGTAPLLPGSRYALVVRSETFQVIGPAGSDRVVLTRRLGTLDATVLDGRLLVSATGGERGRFAVAFDGLAGADAAELEAALTAAPGPTVDAGKRP